MQSPDRVAGRMWITTRRPCEQPTELEVVLIATYVDGRIHRLCELTWPGWSTLQATQTYGEPAPISSPPG